MNSSSDRLDRIEAILAATVEQQQANTIALDRLTERVDRIAAQQQTNTEAIGRLEAQTQANTTAIDRLTERIDGLIRPIQSHQEALRLIAQQQNEWREQMRTIQIQIRDIWQYLNNQLRNRGNGDGGLPGE